jgi:hypothetical protein
MQQQQQQQRGSIKVGTQINLFNMETKKNYAHDFFDSTWELNYYDPPIKGI